MSSLIFYANVMTVKSKLINKEMVDDEELLLPWLESKKEPRKPEKKSSFSRHREGFLQRKGDWTGFWRKRYFRLSKGSLSYYRSDTDEKPSSTILISEISDIIEEVKYVP